MNKHSISLAITTLGFALVFISAARAEDHCVSCHKTLPTESLVGHSFSDWEKSIHNKSGVSCQACHGGNSNAVDKSAAHVGIERSTQKGSPLYFTNIPETCGQCHQAIFKQFMKSAHYTELRRTGRGPNCLTCHGSMATWIIKPDQMEQTCSLCHQKPTQAQAALTSILLAQSTIDKLGLGVPADNKAKEAYASLRSDLGTAIQHWHSFNMTVVLDESHRLIRRARDLSTDWKVSNQKKSQEKTK